MKLNMKNFSKPKLLLMAAVLFVAVGVGGLTLTPGSSSNNVATSEPINSSSIKTADPAVVVSEDGTKVAYQGQDGHSALGLLKDKTQTETENSSFGEYVVSINGKDGGGQKYWLFYVNGQPATVGASDYMTTNNDTIEWRLE